MLLCIMMLQYKPKAQHRFVPQIQLLSGINATYFQQHYYNEYNVGKKSVFKPNIQAQVVFQNSLKKDIYFGVGIGISSLGQVYKSTYADGFCNDFFYMQESETNMSYIQLPISIGYRLKINKFLPYMGLSIAPSWVASFTQQNKMGYTNGQVYTETINKNEVQLNDITNGSVNTIKYNADGAIYNTSNTFLSMHIGTQYAINNKFSLNINLTGQRGLNDIENHKSLSTPNTTYFGFNSFYISKNGNRETTPILYDNGTKAVQVQTKPYKTKLSTIGIHIGLNYNL